MRLIAALAALIFVTDHVTKYFALRHLRLGVPVPVVDGGSCHHRRPRPGFL